MKKLENITLNGESLAEIVDRDSADELRIAIGTPRLRRLTRPAHSVRNHSNAKTSPARVLYRANQKEQKVMFKGQIFSWQEKMPYVASGYSIFGGVEITQDESQAKCAECGAWVRGLANHVQIGHKVSARNYRIRHGINIKSRINAPLVTAATREVFARNTERIKKGHASALPSSRESGAKGGCAKAEIRREREHASPAMSHPYGGEYVNLQSKCEAQRIAALKSFAKRLGRTPTMKEMKSYTSPSGSHPLNPSSLVHFFGLPVRTIFLRAGITPMGWGGPRCKASKG